MAPLITIAEIKVFLKSESGDAQNDALIAACESKAEGIADNRVRGVLADYTAANIPADLKVAIINLSIAEFIAATNNVNFVPQGEYVVDRASRYRKEAFEILDRYYTPKVA